MPLRLERGPRDVEGSQCVLVRRDTREKLPTPLDELSARVRDLLASLQTELLERPPGRSDAGPHEVGVIASRASRSGTERLLFALAVMAATVSALRFLSDGWVSPLASALHEPASHYDLRGPYFGALDLRHGRDPYHGDEVPRPSDRMAQRLGVDRMSTLYPPAVLALYVPLTWLAFPVAKAVNLAAGVACVALTVAGLRVLTGSACRPEALAVAIFLVTGFDEVARTLAIGQSSLVALAALVWGMALLQSRPMAAGGLFAAATLFKPPLGLLLVGLGARRAWRALAAATLTVGGALAVGVALFGLRVHRSFLTSTMGLAFSVQTTPWNQSLHGVLLRSWSPLGPESARAGYALWATLGTVLVAVAARVSARRHEAPRDLSLSLFVVTALLVSPRTWSHYLVWTLVAFALLLWHWAQSERWYLLTATALAYFLLGAPARATRIGAWLLGGPGELASSAPVIGLLLLYVLLVLAHDSLGRLGSITSAPDTRRRS